MFAGFTVTNTQKSREPAFVRVDIGIPNVYVLEVFGFNEREGDIMTTIGYARVSTTDQDLTVQREALTRAGCDIIREDKVSGTSRVGRGELDTILEFLRPGDQLVVTKLDRLARDLLDLQVICRDIEQRGASLAILDQHVDTSTAAGRAFFQMLGVFAEFETGIRKERQAAGIAKAKAEGKYKGRKRTVDVAEAKALEADGLTPTEIARRLEVGRTSVYRALGRI